MESGSRKWFGSRFFLVAKNPTLAYVTVYFREYKYRPYDSVIGLYRLGVVTTSKFPLSYYTMAASQPIHQGSK